MSEPQPRATLTLGLGTTAALLGVGSLACSTQTYFLDDLADRKVDAQVWMEPAPVDAGRDASLAIEPTHKLPIGLDPADISYYQHAKVILDARCVACHAEGGFGPLSLETFDQARIARQAVYDAVATEVMPPFPPDDDACRKLVDMRNMPDTERAILEAWSLAGGLEGDASLPSSYTVPAAAQRLGEPSLKFSLGRNHVETPWEIPRHRCFVIDPRLSEYTSVTALRVLPSNSRVFRRALVHLSLPGTELGLAQREAEDAAEGYDCYYGGGFAGAITLSETLVGASHFAFPDETAVTIPPGSRFVLELETRAEGGTDMPSLALWHAEGVVERAPSTFFVANTSFVIPRGVAHFEAEARGRFIARSATPPVAGEARVGTLWGAAAHMHLRGKSARIELERAAGGSECLLELPAFNTQWEGGYRFVEPVRVEAGDSILVRCAWDNSALSQPIVNGQRLPATDLTIGADVRDETCVGSVLMVED